MKDWCMKYPLGVVFIVWGFTTSAVQISSIVTGHPALPFINIVVGKCFRRRDGWGMNAQQLRDKFEADLKYLQETCKHEDVTDWIDTMWAPGHFGLPAKICRICHKTIQRWEDSEGDNEGATK